MKWHTFKDIAFAELAAIGALIAQALGGWDAALAVLICMMAADYITGLLVATVWKVSPKTEGGRFSSKESLKGLLKKFVMLVVVWVGVMLDRTLGIDYVRTAIILFFIANEGLSVLENTALMGVPYPAFIKAMLEALRDKSDSGKPEAEKSESEDEQ